MEYFTIAFDSLLSRIALDYNLSKDELVDRYMNGVAAPAPVLAVKKPRAPAGAAPKVPKEKKVPIEVRATCGGLTGKRTPCKNKCLAGFDMCHLHCVVLPNGEQKPPKVPKAKAPAKPPRVRAALNEAEAEEGPVDQVAADLDLQARLRLIIREEKEDEEIAMEAQTRARVAEDLRLAEEEERAKKVQTRGMAAEDEARKAKEKEDRQIAKAKGKAPARWADSEEEEEDEEEEDEEEAEMTEDEFAEEELEY